MTYPKGTPLVLRWNRNRAPVSNASFLRDMGVVGTVEVCEIIFKSELWIVRRCEIQSLDEARTELASRWKNEIQSSTKEKQTKVDLAKELGITPGQLRRRVKFVSDWAGKNPQPVKAVGQL